MFENFLVFSAFAIGSFVGGLPFVAIPFLCDVWINSFDKRLHTAARAIALVFALLSTVLVAMILFIIHYTDFYYRLTADAPDAFRLGILVGTVLGVVLAIAHKLELVSLRRSHNAK